MVKRQWGNCITTIITSTIQYPGKAIYGVNSSPEKIYGGRKGEYDEMVVGVHMYYPCVCTHMRVLVRVRVRVCVCVCVRQGH